MKKNLISVLVLALVLVNLVLTAILTISILPQTKKANQLITQVCSAISLELSSGDAASVVAADVPIDKIATYDVSAGEAMTINLKDSGDGKKHYATMNVLVSMDTTNKAYKTYGESMSEKDSLIKSQINTIVSGYTFEEFTGDQKAVQEAILASLQQMFDSDFIIGVEFPEVTSQ